MAKRASSRPQRKTAQQSTAPKSIASPVIAPPARERQWDAIARKQVPQEVRNNLSGAMSGNLMAQGKMFWAMLDTWPTLQRLIGEMQDSVSFAPLEVVPFSEKDKDATPAAVEKAEFVQDAFDKMAGDMVKNEGGFSDLIRNIAYGYYAPPYVAETYWQRDEHGTLPVSSKSISSRFYGYPTIGAEDGSGDHLVMFKNGLMSRKAEPFPEDKFIIAQRLSYPGHPALAAPMRVLTTHWLAAVFGLEWMMQFAQLAGVPFRWATSAETDTAKVGAMLQNLGSAGWGAFPDGTDINFESATSGAQSVPQAVLMKLADAQAQLWITGETLTSDEGQSGSRSLGEVHERQKLQKKQALCKFVARVLTEQLVPSIIGLNFGADDELPTVEITIPEPCDDKANAEVLKLALDMGIETSEEFVYDKLKIPPLEEGQTAFKKPEPPAPIMAPGMPGQQQPGVPKSPEMKEKPEPKKVAAARDQAPIDRLMESVTARIPGVRREWLGGVRPRFEELIARVEAGDEADLEETLVSAARQMPDWFDDWDTSALATALEEAQIAGVVNGKLARLEEG